MMKPLDRVSDTVALIARVAGTSESEVRERLQAEASEIGTNVHQSLKAKGIHPFVASPELDQFYQDSDAFLYETTVWNTCAAKQRMRDFVLSRIEKLLARKADVFCFGDGLGFDSTWLAMHGHNAHYFEPSTACQAYSKEVFQRNGVDVTTLETLEDVPPHSLDVVVCLDVLEHVPQPQQLVKLFHSWLKPDGLLFVHAPFWCLHWTRATHLAENRPLSGELHQLYHEQGFSEIDASLFWDPIVLQRSDNPNPHRGSFGGTVRLRLGQCLLQVGRWGNHIHNAVARRIARAPKQWRDEI